MKEKANIQMSYYKDFDKNGLLLAEYQGKLFEKSVDRFNCSSLVFLRRFIKSRLLLVLDKNQSALVDLNVDNGLNSIEEQFKKNDYGKVKINKEIMFWIGYMYRYISYTRNISTKLVYKYFKPEQMKSNYYVYHTQNPEWVISNLLINNGLNEDIFDKNKRLKLLLQEELFDYQKQLKNSEKKVNFQ